MNKKPLLEDLRLFCTVVRRRGFAASAQELGVSTALISKRIAILEEMLEVKLLHRTTRKVSLTDAGLAALPACRQMLEIAEEARATAAQRSREPAGVLRVTTASSFADAQLTPALIEFQQHYPQVEIVLSVGDKPTDLVAERVDLAVRITNNLDPAMITRPLARCRSMLCASPEYLQRHGLPRTADDLRQHHCIAHAFGIGKQYRLTRNDGEVITVPVDWRFHTNETAILRRAALSGAGIGMLPTYYLGDDLSSGRLVHLLPDHEPDVLGIHAIYLSRQHQPLALRLLVDFLVARFAGEPAPWDLALNAAD